MLCQYYLPYFTDITQLQAYIDKQSQLEDIKYYSCYKLTQGVYKFTVVHL